MPDADTIARLHAAAGTGNSPVLTTEGAVALAAALLDEVERRLLTKSGANETWVTVNTAARHFRIGRRAAETLCCKPGVRHSKQGKGWTRYNLADLSTALAKYGVERA